MDDDQDRRRAVHDSAALTREMMDSPELVDALSAVVAQIPRSVLADSVSVTLRDKNSIHTITSTDEDALVADDLQRELGEGPCLDVLDRAEHYVVDDVGEDSRWPRWGPGVTDLGIRSMICVRLFTVNGFQGTLVVYSRHPRTYTEHDVARVFAIAERVARILAEISRDAHLNEAAEALTIIAQSQNMLMKRYDLGSDQAFELLNQLSQDNDTALRTLAEELTERSDEQEGSAETPFGTS